MPEWRDYSTTRFVGESGNDDEKALHAFTLFVAIHEEIGHMLRVYNRANALLTMTEEAGKGKGIPL